MAVTHDDPFTGIDPTGTPVESVGFIRFEIETGTIMEAQPFWDQLASFEHLGVVDRLTP